MHKGRLIFRLVQSSGFLVAMVGVGFAQIQEEGSPLTITPFQTATFVSDPESARLLNGLAEFSAALLRWTDTPREPVQIVGSVIKSAYLPYYAQWSRGKAGGAKPSSAFVLDRVSDGYRSLVSPRIIRLTIGDRLSLGPLPSVEISGERATQVPFIINNTRASAVRVVFRNIAGPGSDLPLRTLDLQPGQAEGFFLTFKCADGTAVQQLAVQVDGQDLKFDLPLKHHAVGTLQVRIFDESGVLTPARVYLTGADQQSYAPKNHVQRMVLGDYGQPFPGDCYFHAVGSFDLTLPSGATTVEVVKGMEYLPVRTVVPILAGKTAMVEVRLQRKTNLARAGWYSGDVHVHANLFAETRITPRDVLLVAQAEDLNVINLLPCNDPRTTIITDRQYFTGGLDQVSDPDHLVYFNQEMRNDLYGHVGFLNLKSFVEPAYTGFPHSPYPFDYPANYSQAAQAKAQGAVVTYVHPGLPSEFPVDIALGVADTIDAMSQGDEEISTGHWYRLLNCGFRCPISAGTDSFLNIPHHLIPGAGRLYVKSGQPLTYAGWMAGYKSGRSFATNGPLLQFTVNGCEAGEEIRTDSSTITLTVTGVATSFVPMSSLEIIVNGHTRKRIAATGPDSYSLQLAEQLQIEASSWVALRVRGPGHRLIPNDREVYAHTSPVYVTLRNRPIASPSDAVFFIKQIDALIAKMNDRGVYANLGQKDEIVNRFRRAQEIYREIAGQGQGR